MTLSQLRSNINDSRLVKIRVGDFISVPNLEPSALEMVLAPVPALRDPKHLSSEAIGLGVFLHPPIVWRPKPRVKQYVVLGNLRTVEICRRALPSGTTIPAILVSRSLPNTVSRGDMLKLTQFLSSIWNGLDTVSGYNVIHRLAHILHPAMLRAISPELETKSGRERLLGLNRRRHVPERFFAESPTSQEELFFAQERDDV